jgi:hypothetical protein
MYYNYIHTMYNSAEIPGTTLTQLQLNLFIVHMYEFTEFGSGCPEAGHLLPDVVHRVVSHENLGRIL